MRALILRHQTPVWLIAGLALFAAAAGIGGLDVLQITLTEMLIRVLVVVGLYVFIGNSGVISFGQVGFMCIGAYAAGWATAEPGFKQVMLQGLPDFLQQNQYPFPIAMAGAVVLPAIVALLFGIAILRLNGTAASIATFAFLMIVNSIYSNWDSVTAGVSSLIGIPTTVGPWMAFAFAAAGILVAYLFQISRYGLLLRATREDDVAAKASGVHSVRMRLVAFVLSAILVGAGGGLYAQFLGILTVDTFYLNLSFITIAMLVVGGMGSLTGAVVGVVVVTAIVQVLRFGEQGVTLGGEFLKIPAFADRLAAELESTILAEGPDTVAAFIGEPVIGAGAVITPPATYWEKIQAVCRKYDVLVVADEVINGFGRCGTLFACERYNIQPDILVLSKQITSSYMPLAAVLLTDAIYQGVADGSEKLGTFGHGYTASGHPVATAVALENLDIFEERGLVAHGARVGDYLQQRLREFADHSLVGEVRGVGLIGAIELVADKATKAKFDPPGKVGLYLYNKAHENGLVIRSIGDSICFCPPMIITEPQIDEVIARFAASLEATAAWIKDGMQAE